LQRCLEPVRDPFVVRPERDREAARAFQPQLVVLLREDLGLWRFVPVIPAAIPRGRWSTSSDSRASASSGLPSYVTS
jgi:hypothetical protein